MTSVMRKPSVAIANVTHGESIMDWKAMQKQNLVPSYSIPSAYTAIRSKVSNECIEEICDRLPQNQALATLGDNPVTHSVEEAGSRMGRREVTGKIGACHRATSHHLAKLQELIPLLGGTAACDSRASTSRQWVPVAGRVQTPFTARPRSRGTESNVSMEAERQPLQLQPRVQDAFGRLLAVPEGQKLAEAALEAALEKVGQVPAERRLNTGSSMAGRSWASTPIPQRTADSIVLCKVEEDRESLQSNDVLNEALQLGRKKPSPPKQGRPGGARRPGPQPRKQSQGNGRSAHKPR
eukprot:TRINITY_DN15440_c2_g1_i3.p1 TRINITY_DN15440_c2_g1~~TRINITY_DN15440_c2_g1_i3.p1  ORF type:complete len:295 (+),score=45.34 TRINITY_DN15440_c2_g1_i3:77-961(+)